jgi:hypothetical protein
LIRLGGFDSLEEDAIGVFVKATLDLESEHVMAMLPSIEGNFYWAASSVDHLTEVEEDGWISRCPLIAGYFTTSPT